MASLQAINCRAVARGATASVSRNASHVRVASAAGVRASLGGMSLGQKFSSASAARPAERPLRLRCAAAADEGSEGGEETAIVSGRMSRWMAKKGLKNKSLGFDHSGVEIVQVKPEDLPQAAVALYAYGFNYLRNQCGYDSEPGGDLVSVYHLVKVDPDMDEEDCYPEEVCIKCFLPRDNPRVPSVYWIWKTADWQERETYDMYGIIYDGHPHLKRILMPETWEGWPMRKDYITPDFYELQDAY